jgi:hypothetical protein
LLAAIIDMQEKIRRTGTMMGTEFLARDTPDGPARFDADELRRVKDATFVQLGGFSGAGITTPFHGTGSSSGTSAGGPSRG